MKKLLYINVPWMKRYEGVAEDDVPIGKFGYLREHQMNDHCQLNFKKFGGKVYGHVPGSTNPNLTKLGGSRSDSSVGNVTVVWIATDPDSQGRVIVGWYKNATVWNERQNPTGELAKQRTIQESRDCCQFSVEASADDSICLLPGKRPRLNTNDGRPGQNPFWYGSQSADTQVSQLIVNGFEKTLQQKPKAKNTHGGWIQNPIERLKIETNAVNVVERYYTDNGYDVDDVSDKNLGYDLLATSKATELYLEVKGSKAKLVCVELTPNEYSFAKKNSSSFRLCVVIDALNDPKLRIFRPFENATQWHDENGNYIRVVEKIGAVIRE
jgi:hypothetical protein